MIWKLLRRNISTAQLMAFAIAAFVGMTVILVGTQFYSDAMVVTGGKSPVSLPQGRIIVSKEVKMTSTLRGEAPSFTPDEIRRIEAQPWCRGLAPFTAADYAVYASVELGGRAMRTALFFESLPDSLMPPGVLASGDWTFDSLAPFVPVVIPREYLSLYNFGFASSGRMPPLSEGMVSAVPVDITLAGNGRVETLPGRIVGFSDGLNTIAVPPAMMSWASRRFGNKAGSRNPSRLVLAVTAPTAPAVAHFMKDNGYRIDTPEDGDGAATRVIRTLAGVITGVGAVVMSLAVVILVLSLFLIVQKSRGAISGLLLLGYTPHRVSRDIILLTCAVTFFAAVCSFIITCLMRTVWVAALQADAVVTGTPLAAIVWSVALFALVAVVDCAVIYTKVRNCFVNKY